MSGKLRYAISAIIGFGLAFVTLGVFAMVECLPRDDSAEMLACDANKTFFVRAYLLIWVALFVGSAVIHLRGRRFGWLLALLSGFIAAGGALIARVIAF